MIRTAAALLAAAVLLGAAPVAAASDDLAAEREAMVRKIAEYRPYRDALRPETMSERVLAAMRRVERHRFVPERLRGMAYDDSPLPIGYGQTISQPFIVALMTHLLDPEPGDVMLEIGTGSGYQAAVLSLLASRVCTIEIIPELGHAAADRLAALGYDNVEVRVADGYHGWPDCGPFDGIVVTAAADHVPPPLVAQLKPGARMVVPVGGRFATQYLTLVEKSAEGEVSAAQILPVRFVPFTRAAK